MTVPPPPPRTLQFALPRAGVPDLVAALLVLVVGSVETTARQLGPGGLLAVVAAATAVGLARNFGAYALAVVWASAAIQVLSGRDVIFVEVVAAMVVAYGTARHGSRPLLWLSGLSVPVGASLAMAWLVLRGSSVAYEITGRSGALSYAGSAPVLVAVGWLLVAGLLGVPWVAGLAVRARSQADRSRVQQLVAEEERDRAEVERAAAEEIAVLRAEQTRLARDVHDVVGHSLAVILVQAESAGFLPDDDLDRIRLTMTNIATSARRSLQDVRAVLSTTGDGAATGITAPGVDELVADLREAGNDVRSEVVGDPWPLTPEEQTLVFRLAQEMLTNALKHGVRGDPVFVEQRWRGDLLLEVHNRVDTASSPREGAPVGPGPVGPGPVGPGPVGPGPVGPGPVGPGPVGPGPVGPGPVGPGPVGTGPGLGIAGMRRRVEEVGGRLAVRRRDGDDPAADAFFTATAWIPTGGAGA